MSPRRAAALGDDGRSLRDHLITTAARLIAERGTAGLTVRAIAREAGVSDGVLYNHFEDKEELLALALHAHAHAVAAALGDPPAPGAGTVAASLRAHLALGLALHEGILPALAGLVGQPKVLARFAGAENGAPHWRDRLRAYLAAERDLGRLSPSADVEAATAFLVGVCHEAVLTQIFTGARPTPPDIDALIDTLLSGIGP
ncbi:TetR/AcrR family transcriptional regulator [Actinomadura kijaniata]|uniref:AcrR family transcriptional regulator n=1 Tax=Actinomadura namibiensis TaxID=182080 RepID=A0A7W3QQE1_ACTNM|nr:TetR/AcrR family transcriptional regulator [Actinomadura namibiensis]MBA8955619.1 AcrR family transcriptional regulator [Actinomadura namibiensis]